MRPGSKDADAVASPGRVALVRALGQWGLTALTIMSVVGAGILVLLGEVHVLAGTFTGRFVVGAFILA